MSYSNWATKTGQSEGHEKAEIYTHSGPVDCSAPLFPLSPHVYHFSHCHPTCTTFHILKYTCVSKTVNDRTPMDLDQQPLNRQAESVPLKKWNECYNASHILKSTTQSKNIDIA
jgi:hypothetical protein